jgi:hypothetical protein
MNNAHYFLLTRIFYFRQYLFTVLLCSPPAEFRKICYSIYGATLVKSSDGSGTGSRNHFQGGKTVPTHGLFNLGNKSKSDELLSGLYGA